MPFNGSGTYTLPGAALSTGGTVSATEHNTFRSDVATALSNCLTLDYQTPWGPMYGSATKLGIGVSTPLYKVDIQGTGADTMLRHLNTGTSASDDSIISIQTSATGSTITISGFYFGDGDNQTVGRLFYEHTSDAMTFYTNSAEAMRLTSAGYNLIGYTSSNGAYKLQVNSQIFATNATIATSDGRYKDDVQPLADGLATINALEPVTFKWKAHPVHNFPVGETDIGFIAQQVQATLNAAPYLASVVKENQNGDESFLGLADSKLIPILVKAVQELSARVEALEAV